MTDSKAFSLGSNVSGLGQKWLDHNQVIAIDGPAASGKSTAAQRVAVSLNFVHVNSATDCVKNFAFRSIRLMSD